MRIFRVSETSGEVRALDVLVDRVHVIIRARHADESDEVVVVNPTDQGEPCLEMMVV